ncbi:MAG TPA: energy transducer TonB [Bryobacteraceae bacterium]|nr:energy transducer TonB [Bryobacteraceae bacterium]
MFEQTFVNTAPATKKPWTVGASATVQAILVGVALLMPLLHPGVIHPDFNLQPALYLTKLAQPPAPPEAHTVAVKRRARVFTGLVAPRRVPATIDMTAEPAPAIADEPVAGATSLALLLPEQPVLPPAVAEAPPPPAPKPPAPPAQVRVSSGTQAAKLIFGPAPPYPPLARTARIQGTVKLEATIARDGSIRNLHLVSGAPLLVKAALDAAGQWRYQPTLLNGEPVEVVTEIDVNFRLN